MNLLDEVIKYELKREELVKSYEGIAMSKVIAAWENDEAEIIGRQIEDLDNDARSRFGLAITDRMTLSSLARMMTKICEEYLNESN